MFSRLAEIVERPRAFVRTDAGVITTFKVSGAPETFAAAINTSGAVVGNYLNSSSNSRGYLRSASGAITTFDTPGSGTTKGTGTFVYGINSAETTVGLYFESGGPFHAFLRTE